jgi:hypothetical protein
MHTQQRNRFEGAPNARLLTGVAQITLSRPGTFFVNYCFISLFSQGSVRGRNCHQTGERWNCPLGRRERRIESNAKQNSRAAISQLSRQVAHGERSSHRYQRVPRHGPQAFGENCKKPLFFRPQMNRVRFRRRPKVQAFLQWIGDGDHVLLSHQDVSPASRFRCPDSFLRFPCLPWLSSPAAATRKPTIPTIPSACISMASKWATGSIASSRRSPSAPLRPAAFRRCASPIQITRRHPFEPTDGGDGGIRTLDRALQPYNGLANRRLQPLGHVSNMADMPDAGASRKRQICVIRISANHLNIKGLGRRPRLPGPKPQWPQPCAAGRPCGATRPRRDAAGSLFSFRNS